MKKENVEKIREKIISLIETEYESDAAFERAMGLPSKTVNNWRRGRSAAFMNMLPSLCEGFGISLSELMDMPVKGDGKDLSEDELRLLSLYRKARILPGEVRSALEENLENTIKLYISACKGIEGNKTSKRQKCK